MVLIILLGILFSITFADAATRNTVLPGRSQIAVRGRSVADSNGASIVTAHFFDQLIDHGDPSLGTFRQRYWTNWEFYKNGGPIVLSTPGDASAYGYAYLLTNQSISGMIAQQQHGATVLIEHRFFGYSNPYPNLTSHSLEYLTIEQAISDLVYFAQTVNLTMPDGDSLDPDTIPWVLAGASYAGALVSWTMMSNPGVFRAGYASSAVVQAITNFYAYFTPIREYMPQNCSSDVQAVIAYLDRNHAENNMAAIQGLKEAFGLESLSHIDDFAVALTSNLMSWQNIQPYFGPGSFYEFCDALEVKNGTNAPPTGWGLEHAIHAWGSFWNNTYFSRLCENRDVEACVGSYNASLPYWTNVTVNRTYRSWLWLRCNQLGFFQAGPPLGEPAIASRIIQPSYIERLCVNMFPDKFSSPPSPPVSVVNDKYKGWNVDVDRLFFANGRRDSWWGATVSAKGRDKANTAAQPVYESDGFHASDMFALNGIVDESVGAVQSAGLQYMGMWLA